MTSYVDSLVSFPIKGVDRDLHYPQGRWLTTECQINLEHESMLYDDTLRELPIRQLCSKLVGLHTFKEHRFRIVPERAGEGLDDIGQLFGGCLVLMHLKDIYERCLRDDSGDDGRYYE